MRIVSWNCHDDFRSKFGHLERLKPDIAVVQEVRPGCLEFAGLQGQFDWVGDPGQKGLALIAYGDWKLSPAEMVVSERWFLPRYATNGKEKVDLVGVWLNPAKGASHDYVSPTLRALEQLREFISPGPSIVAGDFNASVSVDHRLAPKRRFSAVLKKLDELHLCSAWHVHTSEQQGSETQHTYFHFWDEERKFHIDFHIWVANFASAKGRDRGI